MSYTAALKMPSSYAVMNEEEMTYLEGGGIRIPNSRAYLNKSACQQLAAEYVRYGVVTGMTSLEVAQEIYAHAYVYYNWQVLKHIPIASSIYKSAADGIDLENEGDTPVRKAFYAMVWNNF